MAKTRSEVVARVRATDLRKMLKYSAVSAIAFPLTQVTLLVLSVGLGWSGVASNFTAVTLMAVPAYVLNRYWVWGKKDKNRFATEILPFWLITVAGLVLSTIFAHYADQILDTPFAVNLANTAGFGIVWVFKFLCIDRLMFGGHQHFPIDEDLEAELESAPAV